MRIEDGASADAIERLIVGALLDDREPFRYVLAEVREASEHERKHLEALAVIQIAADLARRGLVRMLWFEHGDFREGPISTRELLEFGTRLEHEPALGPDPDVVGLWLELTPEGNTVVDVKPPGVETVTRVIEAPLEGALTIYATSLEYGRAYAEWYVGDAKLPPLAEAVEHVEDQVELQNRAGERGIRLRYQWSRPYKSLPSRDRDRIVH